MNTTQEVLSQVMRVRGVRAVVLSSIEDALPISAITHVDVDAEALAAFGTSLMRRACQVSATSRLGAVRFVTLDASGGRVLTASRSDLLVIALAGRDAHSGLVRVSLQRALEGVA